MAESLSQTATETLPTGNRRGNRLDEQSTGNNEVQPAGGGQNLPTGGMATPGVTKDTEEKESLKIKIHLNLHAKIKLELDAQLYGDIVIGLL